MVTHNPSEYDTLCQEVAQWAQAQPASWRNHAFRTDSLLSPTSKGEYEVVFDPCSFSFEKAAQVLSAVVTNRRRHLWSLTRKSEFLCPLDGRCLEYNCQETTFSCTPQERTNGFFDELVAHPSVLRVVALSGGYSREDANARLSRNKGVIASFSRALTEGLSAQQSESEFNSAIGASIASIYAASIS